MADWFFGTMDDDENIDLYEKDDRIEISDEDNEMDDEGECPLCGSPVMYAPPIQKDTIDGVITLKQDSLICTVCEWEQEYE